ncbi:hypothetical protein GHI93_10055 [Lactococcus hircilactis]|uniref:Uncharacterized protein n=1 Tax=Lactococcus hircilactis TaxID=1494462 RepID=A0A7X2D170_9LACT|nr:hypothetical protein [Lactococcus hircilactis]MQW40268.1 hypothetical protein [Lactococcus hircilactis]
MKIIKAVHVDGIDKKRRYWIVPEHLKAIRLKRGDEAIVNTSQGQAKVRIVGVTNSKEGFIYWKKENARGKFQVTQEVVKFCDKAPLNP